jgi:hypothetical protein
MDKKHKPLSAALVDPLDEAIKHQDRIEERIRRQRLRQQYSHVAEMMVAPVEGKITAHVNSDEHPPPHVHIKYSGEEARFRIDNGERLPQDKDLTKYQGTIRKWIIGNQRLIIVAWNESRPSDCPVGLMPLPRQ